MKTQAAMAVAIGLLSCIAAAGLGSGGASADYAAASEARQQKFLDGLAAGFRHGFNATAGQSATIERLVADAEHDLVSVDIKYLNEGAETVSGNALVSYRNSMYAQNCNYLSSKKLLENGVRLKIRVKRPSGAMMTNFSFDAESCAGYVKTA